MFHHLARDHSVERGIGCIEILPLTDHVHARPFIDVEPRIVAILEVLTDGPVHIKAADFEHPFANKRLRKRALYGTDKLELLLV